MPVDKKCGFPSDNFAKSIAYSSLVSCKFLYLRYAPTSQFSIHVLEDRVHFGFVKEAIGWCAVLSMFKM
ncbi:MAG TPA: hypothetical protein HA306_11365 [Methanosarcina sp.]|nr:hypothetical protein [Methanosarcina sp.]